VKGYEKIGQLMKALAFAKQQLVLNPYDESTLRSVMNLLARQGKRNEAIKEFESTRNLLWNDLAVNPEIETLVLAEQLRNENGDQQKQRNTNNNLPFPLGPLIGRELDLAQLYWKLVDPTCRLTTILGMGGSGKTHLALEASRAMLPAFPDGVFWVELGSLNSTNSILPVVANVVGLHQGGSWIQETVSEKSNLLDDLSKYLKNREALLVFDGAEGVAEGLSFIPELLTQATGLRVLVTSRLRLNLLCESIFPLKGVLYPENIAEDPSKYGAVQLFITILQRFVPEIEIDAESMRLIAEICRLVQGMPLAILLAAGGILRYGLGEILQAIKNSLDFLSASWHDLPARQRSLRASFEFSWGLLDAEQQASLRRLSLFRDGFDLERGRLVCKINETNVRSLLEVSLVQKIAGDRYRMHDLVREYSLEKLLELPEECQEIHECFCAEYIKALENWDHRIRSADQMTAMQEFELEIENANQAWNWSVQNEKMTGLEDALMGLCRYCQIQSRYQDGRQVCQSTLDMIQEKGLSPETLHLWARSCVWWDIFTCNLDRDETMPELSIGVCQLLQAPEWAEVDTRWELAYAHQYLGNIRLRNYPWQNLPAQEYLSHLQTALELFRQCGDNWNESVTLLIFALYNDNFGNIEAGRQALEAALEIQQSLCDPFLLQEITYNLACSWLFVGETERGLFYMTQACAYMQQTSSLNRLAKSMLEYSIGLTWAGKFQEARELMGQCQSTYADLKQSLPDLGQACLCAQTMFLGLYDEYEQLVEKFDLAHQSRGNFLLFAGAAYLIKGQLDIAAQYLEEALCFFEQIGDTRLLVYFQALLSVTHYRRGKRSKAWHSLIEAVNRFSKETNIFSLGHLTLVIAYFLQEVGELEKAAEIYTSALQHPLMGNSIWAQDFVGKEIACKISNLPVDVLEMRQHNGVKLSYKEAIDEGMVVLQRRMGS
jgi:predicted ATPase